MAILKIGGKDVDIKSGTMSVADGILIEDEYGKTFDEWMKDLENKRIKAAAIGILVLARRSDKSITLDDVLALDLNKLFESVAAAMNPPALEGELPPEPQPHGKKEIHPTGAESEPQ